MLEKHKEIVLPVLENAGGRLVKTIGDAFMMVFESPTDAVLSGIAVQAALKEFNEGKEGDDRIDVRIAINTGEVTLADNDIFGDPVNITARIESIAEAGEVFFTEAVYLAMNKHEVPSSEVGLLQLKGIPEKVRVYKVVAEHPVEELPGGQSPAQASSTGGLVGTFRDRRKAAASPPGVFPLKKSTRRKRLGALIVDAVIVSIFAGFFFGSEKTNYHWSHKIGGKKKQEIVLPKMKIDDKGISVGENITINDKGINIGEAVKINDEGIKIGDNVEIDDGGIKAGDEVVGEEVLHEDGKNRVVKITSKKDTAFPILWVLYSTFFLLYWGATPGKRIFKMKVVDHATGAAPDWKASLARSLFMLVSFAVLFLGFLWAFVDKESRCWHDLIAGTMVVSAE